MKYHAYWLLACAAGTTACAGSKPEAREARPEATWREPAPAVVPLEDQAANTKPKPAASEPEAPATAEADNTKRNERDRDERALTPMDQGNGDSDTKITQRIRQAVMDDDSLSFNAKNVKIITVDGKVTLRGPVASSKERATIDAAAKKVAGGARVDDQLEIEK